MSISTFQNIESRVCRYGQAQQTVFTKAKGSQILSEGGKSYIDFLIGSGALNYGHNHPEIMGPTIDYIVNGNIQPSLDMYTAAKRAFLDTFTDVILKPRGMSYKIQFPGPTGTNANEALRPESSDPVKSERPPQLDDLMTLAVPLLLSEILCYHLFAVYSC